MKAIELKSKDGVELHEITEEYMRKHGLVFMDYYRWRVLGTRQQVIDFAHEGMMECEGSQRDRLVDIYLDAMAGELFCCDWTTDGEDPYDERKLVDWATFQED